MNELPRNINGFELIEDSFNTNAVFNSFWQMIVKYYRVELLCGNNLSRVINGG